MEALIFGAFNPVTKAHINMGISAWDRLGSDYSVTYVPASDAYIRNWKGYKEGSTMPAAVRIKLLQGAIKQYGLPFKVSAVETDGITDGRTYNTVKHFGFDECVICLGMDNILQMKKWYNWEELLRQGKFLIFRRGVYEAKQETEIKNVLKHMSHYKFANMCAGSIGISSTKVRNSYVDGDFDKLEKLVSKNVYEYLKENDHVYF